MILTTTKKFADHQIDEQIGFVCAEHVAPASTGGEIKQSVYAHALKELEGKVIQKGGNALMDLRIDQLPTYEHPDEVLIFASGTAVRAQKV